MPVNIKPSATAPKADAATATEPEAPQIRLILKLYERYDFKGYTYKKGMVYSFTPERAEQMLLHEDAWNRPVFARYRAPQAERMVVRGLPEVRMSEVVPAKSTIPPKEKKAPEALVIGTEAELADVLSPEDLAEAGLGQAAEDDGQEIG